MYKPKFATVPPGPSLRADQWPHTLMWEPYAKTAVRLLPHRPSYDSAWIIGRRSMETVVEGQKVDLILCVELDSNIRASIPVPRNTDPTALLEVVWNALLEPNPGCESFRPMVIACEDEELARKIEPMIAELGIEAGVADIAKPLESAFRRVSLHPVKQLPLRRG